MGYQRRKAMPRRELFSVRLHPLAGDRFQPTGFPDIGAATYERPTSDGGWQTCLLVESAQSMANHLEATAWDSGECRPVDAFADMPYVRVVDGDGRFLTSSRTEAHRVASAFIKDATYGGKDMRTVIRERLGLRDDAPLAPRQIAEAVFQMDPLCLVHGVFFAESAKVWPGQPKIARALTAFVEAHDVREVISGGVKRDEVRHAVGETGGAAEGYGFVPFHRTEWVARDIVAYFCLDLEQIVSYGLPEPAGELLATAARYEVRALLDRGFRPRTACDLIPVSEIEFSLPTLDNLTVRLRELVGECSELVGDGSPMEVTWSAKKAKS
jgi:CRISPR-associated protein Csb1